MTLNAEQMEVIDGIPTSHLERIAKDLRDRQSMGIHPSTFFLAMHPAFRAPNITPDAVADYCEDSIKRRDVTE